MLQKRFISSPCSIVVYSIIFYHLNSTNADEVLKEPLTIYKIGKNSSRESLFTRVIKRPNSLVCLLGESVADPSPILKRRSNECPSVDSVLGAKYSAVFHEKDFNTSLDSTKPYWTVLLDVDIHPLALASLTGFLFKYRSLEPLRPLDGEVGFTYHNLPLRRTDKDTGRSIALKAPYRNSGEFEISICPLPLCNNIENQNDCTKLDIQIPNANSLDRNKLQELPSEKVLDCQTPAMKTSKLRTILIESEKLVLTFKGYNETFDSVTVNKLEGPWIETYRCPSSFYENLDTLQTSIEKEGQLNMDECFLVRKAQADWKLFVTAIVFGSLMLVGVFVGLKRMLCRHCRGIFQRKRHNVTYNDTHEAAYLHLQPELRENRYNDTTGDQNSTSYSQDANFSRPGDNTYDPAAAAFDPVNISAPRNQNQSEMSEVSSIQNDTSMNPSGYWPRMNTSGPHTIHNCGSLNASRTQHSIWNTTGATSSTNDTSLDPTSRFARVNTSGPKTIHNISNDSRSQPFLRRLIRGVFGAIRRSPSSSDVSTDVTVVDSSQLQFGRINTSGPRNIDNISDDDILQPVSEENSNDIPPTNHLNQSIHPILAGDYSYESGKSDEDNSGCDSGRATGSGFASGNDASGSVFDFDSRPDSSYGDESNSL